MTKKINVGIIGLGEVSQLMHLPIISDNSHKFTISGIYDVSQSSMDYVCAKYANITPYDSAQSLLESDAIDAVFILTPDHTHSELLAKAIQCNKHVFLEKPACLSSAELEAIIPLTKQTSKVLFVGYMRRYCRAFTKAKSMLPENRDIRTVRIRDLICEGPFFINQSRTIHYADDVSDTIVTTSKKQTDSLLSSVVGDDAPASLKRAYQVLTGLSSHSLSAMRELIGLPHKILSADYRQGGDSIVVTFDYGNFIAVYEAMIDNIARFEARIDILSEYQQLEISYDTPYIRNLPTQLKVITSDGNETQTIIHGPDYLDPFQIELDCFYDHIINGTKPKTSLTDSREDLILLGQIANAMKKNLPHE